MKFKIITSGDFYENEDAEDLRELGFKFKPIDYEIEWLARGYHKVIDKTHEVTVTLETLEDLVKFTKRYGDVIVIADSNPTTLEIYNDHRE